MKYISSLATLTVAIASLSALSASTMAATILYAVDTTISATNDPGGIVGDGLKTTAIPGWQVTTDASLLRNVVQVAIDTGSGDPQKEARGIVQFGISSLEDGLYHLSMLTRTVNIKNTSANQPRDQSFAVRLVSLGTASLNGVQGGVSDWIIVKPLSADYSSGGHSAPWLELNLAGAGNEAFSVSGSFDTFNALSLSGVNGVDGWFRIEVLDGTGSNYGVIFVDSFTFTPVPEPSAVVMVVGCSLWAGLRLLRKRSLPQIRC